MGRRRAGVRRAEEPRHSRGGAARLRVPLDAGLDYWESLGYAFAGSALWEIAGESTLPSRNDQINTGIGGSFLGEVLFRLANLALSRRSGARQPPR